MITCYDISRKRTVLINPRYVISVELGEDAIGKYAEINIKGSPFMIKVKENAREIEQIKKFFEIIKEDTHA